MPPFDPFPGAPGVDVTGLFNERKVLRAESRARKLAEGRPGVNPDSPFLPGGRVLRWPELTEVNALMNEGYGFNTLVDEIMRVHKPFAKDAAGQWGTAQDAGPFYWVQKHTPGETRSYGRIGIERSALMADEADESLFALSQTNFQYREERMNMMNAGKLRTVGSEGWSTVFPSSGTRPTLSNIRRLMKQRKGMLDQAGTKVIFDLETASLMPEHGIRQLSYRVIDPAGKATSKTLNFENATMGLGHYSDTLKDVEGKIVDGKIVRQGGLLAQERVAEELTEFFGEAGSARYLIGQNAMFDVGMLAQLKQQAIWQHGQKLIDGATASQTPIDKLIQGLSGRDKTAVELAHAGNKFFQNAYSDNFVDTSAHARILMSQVGGERLGVAAEIAQRGEAKLFSIENILLQSSFLQDITDQGLADKQSIREMFRLDGPGLHSADVDTFFTDMLSRLQNKAYQQEPGKGQYLLRPRTLDQDMINNIWEGQDAPDVGVIRKMISSARAITPFTNLDMTTLTPEHRQTLERIGGREWVDELTAGKRHITGFEHMMLLSRDLAVTSPAAASFKPGADAAEGASARKLASKSGLFQGFLKDRNIVNEMGGLNPFARLPNEQEWKTFQQTLSETGAHFPGLSFGERTVSSLFAEASSAGNVDLQGAMRALSDVTPVSIWQSSQLAAFPVRRAPKTTAIPVEYLKAMELKQAEAGYAGPKLLHGTAFAAAEDDKALQYLSVSPFEYRDWRGRQIQDVALSVQGAIESDPEARTKQITAMMDFIREHEKATLPEAARATEESLQRLAQGLHATGHTTGIQVATLAGQGGGKGATRVFNLLKHLGYDVDKARTGWRLPYLFSRTAGEGAEAAGQLGVGPALSAAGGLLGTLGSTTKGAGRIDTPAAAALEGNILNQNKLLKEGYAAFESAVVPDKRLLSQVGAGGKLGGWADKLPNLVSKYITPQLRPRSLAIAGGALALGIFWNRRKKSASARDVMDRQEYEDPGFYARYKRGMGETPPVTPIANRGRNMYALATADLPAYLDDRKTGHTNMSRDYSFLFGGGR